jgi:hypothetical protein
MHHLNFLLFILTLGISSNSMADRMRASHNSSPTEKLPEAECARLFSIMSPEKNRWQVVVGDGKKSVVYRISGNEEIREMIYQWTTQVDADQVHRSRTPSGIHVGFARNLFLSMLTGEIQSQRVRRYPVAFGEFRGVLTIESSPEDSKFVSMTFELSHSDWVVSQ